MATPKIKTALSVQRQALLDALPPGTPRVQVVDEFKKLRFKDPTKLSDEDQLVLDLNGAPICMGKSPGRPRHADNPKLNPPRPVLAPSTAAVGEVMRLREEHLKADRLVALISTNPEKSEVLDYIMQGLAEESCVIGFERQEAERRGEATSQISIRRVNTLKSVGDVWLKRKEQISNNGVDMDSPAFKRLFGFILATFRQGLIDSGLRPEMIETVFAGLSKKLGDDWNKEATRKMLGE